MSRLYACSREGNSTFYKPGEERKRAKMSRRVNCKAAVKMKKKGKEWIYEKVLLKHSHTLNPDACELKHIRSHKNKDPVIMELIDDLQTCDVSPNATMNVLTRFHGNRDLMPWNERDLQNRKAENVRKERADDVKKLKAFFKTSQMVS
ncbi:protein FAR1-RELATED SEQUENCE 5-like [Hordeum vulgare]|nr:protein FAR1-RELATED SEQUENCE 5-like [Hordeum vulgare]